MARRNNSNNARQVPSAIVESGSIPEEHLEPVGNTTEEVVEEVTPVVEAPKFSTNEELVAAGFTTVSAQIRELNRQGMAKGAIAKQLGKIYQHVYNVLSKPLKKVPATPAVDVEEPSSDVVDEESAVESANAE
jgi:hypothetical protein